MNPLLKNIIAIVVGALVGMIVNGGLIALGNVLLPLPGGAPQDMEAMSAAYQNAPLANYLWVFFAHAAGTLVGAFAACKIAATHHKYIGLGIGAFFLIGGAVANYQIQGPSWFMILDIAVAYLPMGWFGWKLAGSK